MLERFLSLSLTGIVTFALLACDDFGSSSQSSEEDSPKVGSESSSSISSSSRDSTAPKPHFNKLPFDTAGVNAEIFSYEPLQEDEDSTYYREVFGKNIKNAYWLVPENGGYCYTIDEPTGELGGGYVSDPGWNQVIIVERNDSLLLSDYQSCSSFDWNGCRKVDYAYTQKISVGVDIFYYGEFESKLLLIKLTDSTITRWTVKNPSYVPPAQDTTIHGFEKRWFDGDSMVTFVGDNPNSDYVDTIFIEKYNLKITDSELTWIFENETCTKTGYKARSGKSSEDSCNDYIEYYNDGAKCIQRNMGLSGMNFPRLCRPEPFRYTGWNVWCILDGDMPTEFN